MCLAATTASIISFPVICNQYFSRRFVFGALGAAPTSSSLKRLVSFLFLQNRHLFFFLDTFLLFLPNYKCTTKTDKDNTHFRSRFSSKFFFFSLRDICFFFFPVYFFNAFSFSVCLFWLLQGAPRITAFFFPPFFPPPSVFRSLAFTSPPTRTQIEVTR